MKKKHILFSVAAVICILLMMGLAACGENENTEGTTEENTETTAESTEQLSSEQLNEEMLGVWLPAEGVENDTVSFGYTSDAGSFDKDPSGQLCIHVGYAKFEGGGASAAEYEYQDGKLIYTTVDGKYSAGGGIEKTWTVDTEKLSEGKAIINGVAYERVTDDPSDSERTAYQIIDSRVKPLLAGEWQSPEGGPHFTLNEDGTMHYENAGKSVDGTWKSEGGMTISLTYNDPDTSEEVIDYYHYDFDEDCLEGMDERFDRQ